MTGRARVKRVQIDWDQIPVLSQRQDSLTDQLNDLTRVANRLGMYDASDWLGRNRRDLLRKQEATR